MSPKITILYILLLTQWIPPINSQHQQCTYDFTAQADIVFILDRSGSQRSGPLSTNFDQMKSFLRDFIHHFLVLRPDQHRIAVVSYGADVTTNLDFVSVDPDGRADVSGANGAGVTGSGGATVSECELFAAGGLWETQVRFDTDRANAPVIRQLFKEAFHRAMQILRRSNRRNPALPKHVWILSDLQMDTELPLSYRDYEMANMGNLHLFGYGIGRELHMQHFYTFVTDRCNALTHTEWAHVIQNQVPFARKTDETYVDLTDSSLCPSQCGQRGCACLEFTHSDTNEFFRCTAPPNSPHSPDSSSGSSSSSEETHVRFGTSPDPTTWIVVGVACGVIFVALLVVLVACCVRRGDLPKVESYVVENEEREQTPVSGMPEMSTFTVDVAPVPSAPNSPDLIPEYCATMDHVYTNEDLELALRAHGLTTRLSDKRMEVAEGVETHGKAPKQGRYIKNKGDTVNGSKETLSKSINRNTALGQSNKCPLNNEMNEDKNGRSLRNRRFRLLPATFKSKLMPGLEKNLSSNSGTDAEYSYTYMDTTIPKPKPISYENIEHATKKEQLNYQEHIGQIESNAGRHNYMQCTLPTRKKEDLNTQNTPGKTNGKFATLEDFNKLKMKLKSLSSDGMNTITNPIAAPDTHPTLDYVNSQLNEREKHKSMKLGTVKFQAIKSKLERMQSWPVESGTQNSQSIFSVM